LQRDPLVDQLPEGFEKCLLLNNINFSRILGFSEFRYSQGDYGQLAGIKGAFEVAKDSDFWEGVLH